MDSNTGVAHVELARPEKWNALDLSMFEAIARVAHDLSKDRHVRAVVLSGQGKSFSSGLDVKSIAKSGIHVKDTMERLLKRRNDDDGDNGHNEHDYIIKGTNLVQTAALTWRNIPVPVVSAIHGVCYGGALQIVMGTDLRFASPESKWSMMEIQWGIIPDMAGTITMLHGNTFAIRPDVWMELAMTGRIMTGKEAQTLGFVTKTVEQPVEYALEWARQIATKQSPDAIARIKQMYYKSQTLQGNALLELETKYQRELLASWNQLIATGRNLSGLDIPYRRRTITNEDESKDEKKQ